MKNTEVFNKLLSPINDDIIKNEHYRECPEISDLNFVHIGVLRVLGNDKSGRAFLQRSRMEDIISIDNSIFFKSLNSKRRLMHLIEVDKKLTDIINHELIISDRLKGFKELDKFEVFASDGSYIEWACHDIQFQKPNAILSENNSEEIIQKRNEVHKQSRISTQNFFSVNLRTGTAKHLTLAQTNENKKKEHDMHALKRLDKNILRNNTKTGRKVLHVYDRASIDYFQWYKWRNNDGIYFLTRDKSNSKLQIIGKPEFDRNDPINSGVISNEMVGTGNGEAFRRIVYKCPDTNEIFSFVTTLPDNIRPGVIVMLYKLRWEIEKTFDTFKNKLEEKKAWGTSENAKTCQALFICLTHNLTLLMQKNIEDNDKIKYEYDKNRKENNLSKKQLELSKKNIAYPSTWEITLKVSQITIKFFRWLRVFITKEASWCDAITKLQAIYEEN